MLNRLTALKAHNALRYIKFLRPRHVVCHLACYRD